MVEFAGWSMPVQYTTITEEHRAVRERVGLFDISHMGRLQFGGPDAEGWLERTTTNHVARLQPGQIQYSLMVEDAGGVLDDLLVYRLPEDGFGVVCNASNRPKVIGQLEALKGGLDATMEDRTFNLAMIAIQGPCAVKVLEKVVAAPLSSTNYYHLTTGTVPQLGDARVLISRTGYTGEDGFEVAIRASLAEPFCEAVMEAGGEFGILPCGLGARDTLRFEAAMPLYGHELGEEINPYEAGVGWAIKLSKREFVGRAALEDLKRSPGRTRIGLRLEGKRIARQGSVVLRDGTPVGVVTSGTFAPTLGQSLAMALVDPTASGVDTALAVEIRGHAEPARVVTLPFYRRVGA
jgi:aminomethyltransferase